MRRLLFFAALLPAATFAQGYQPATLTGSGTSGQVTTWNGTGVTGASTFTFSSALDALISGSTGTTAPAPNFEANAKDTSNNVLGLQVDNGSSTPKLQCGYIGTGGQYISSSSSGDVFCRNNGTGAFWLGNGSTAELAIPTSGRVLVNTTTDDGNAALQVNGTIESKSGGVLYPDGQTQAAAVTGWTSFTPTGTWSTNTTYTGYYRRVGKSIDVRWHIALTGAPDNANLSLNPPSGITLDTTKMPGGSTGGDIVGFFRFADSDLWGMGGGTVTLESSVFVLRAITMGASTTAHTALFSDLVGQTAPYSVANADTIDVAVTGVPIQ